MATVPACAAEAKVEERSTARTAVTAAAVAPRRIELMRATLSGAMRGLQRRRSSGWPLDGVSAKLASVTSRRLHLLLLLPPRGE
jgi:hypothetical protein